MASLHILKGVNQGTQIPLDHDRIILGRNPECHVVIPVTSVSREHAHILRQHGRYYIEDLQSRNGTKVNNQPVTARTLLRNNDKIQICDFQAAFIETPTRPLPPGLAPAADEGEEEAESSSTVEATLSHSSHLILETQPAEKLKALLDISSNLSKTLELDPLLPKIVDTLFQVFKQADRCFLILTDETGRLLPKVVKTRRPQDEPNARPSRTIVRRCLETAQAYLSDDASSDKSLPLSQSVVDFRIRSVMSAPLCGADGKGFGVIQLDTQDRGKKFTQDDLKLLLGVANQAAVALENARLHEESVERERTKRDLELARQVQLRFLPKQLPQVPGYDFFGYYEAAQEVGGDYYDFVALADGRRLAVLIGDVAGKGIPAALLMAKLSSDARVSLLREAEAAAAINRLNDMMYEYTAPIDRFVTLAAAMLYPSEHRVTLVNAGHWSPLLYQHATGVLEEAMPKDVAGMPLGMIEQQSYDSLDMVLQPGDCLLIFTDGVIDAHNVRGEAFGIQGVHNALRGGGPYNSRTLIERLVKAVKLHAAGRAQNDDITLVALARTG